MSSCQPDLKKIFEQCENRCVVFENGILYQVDDLMQNVENVSLLYFQTSLHVKDVIEKVK